MSALRPTGILAVLPLEDHSFARHEAALTPEELAWEMSAGKVTLIVEPVRLFDRAISVTLEYLAAQKK